MGTVSQKQLDFILFCVFTTHYIYTRNTINVVDKRQYYIRYTYFKILFFPSAIKPIVNSAHLKKIKVSLSAKTNYLVSHLFPNCIQE